MLLNSAGLNTALLNDTGVSSGSGGGGGAGGFGAAFTRFVPGDELALITEGTAYSVHGRVKIAGPDGVLIDYRSRNGINWIDSIEMEANIDAPIATATVKLLRSVGTKSLAPLRTDSLYNQLPYQVYDPDAEAFVASTAPSLDVGRRITIETASIPCGASPADDDWHMMFDGVIDTVDWSQNPVVLECRDKGAQIQDCWFPGASIGGGFFDAPIQDVIVALLEAGHLNTAVPLSVPLAPDPVVVIPTFTHSIESVMETLQRLVQINGWDLRYRWSDIDQEFRLTFKDPGRTRVVADYFFTSGMYIDVKALKIDVAAVRNDIWIWYGTSSEDQHLVFANGAYTSESVRRYGRRTMVLQEASDSPIQTEASAQTMADLIAYDLATPLADKEIDMPYFWPVELHNVINFAPNLVHSDVAMDLAVVSYKHTLTREQTRTTMRTRNKPAGSYYRWLGRRPPSATDPTSDTSPSGFSELTQLPDYATDTVTLTWSWGGDPSATFRVFCWIGNTPASVGIDVGTDLSYDYVLGIDIEPFPIPPTPAHSPTPISFYVVAVIGSVITGSLSLPTSSICTVTYDNVGDE